MKKLLLAPVFAAVLASCNSTDPNTHQYPAQAKTNFMNSCNEKSGGKKEMCACLFDKIQAKYTYGEFVHLDSQMSAGQRPPEFMTFMESVSKDCVNAK